MTSTKALKIVLLGDPGTGKTSLLSQITRNHFDPKYNPTAGLIETAHEMHVNDQRVATDIWDVGGRDKYRYLVDALLSDADAILLVYDVSNPASFDNVAVWLRHIRQSACLKTVIKLVGNKNDLQSRVPSLQAHQFATLNDLSYIETSALNNNNVHLAFESIAQAKQSSTFVQKDPKTSSDDKPFQVVLIDIEQASLKNIVCVEKPLDETKFIAISYRWGQVEEQVIDTHLGYMASVTSFHLNDFYQLCRDIMKETDLRSIKYVWVDAICVDQMNQARHKATIYQMANIYHRAASILAVPDLHLEYLKNTKIFTHKFTKHRRYFNEYIYYLLHGKTAKLVQATEQWFDRLGIPKDEMARKMLTRPYCDSFPEYLLDSCDESMHVNENNIQDAINESHDHAENTTMVYENSDCALCSLQMYTCNNNQKWLPCVVRELKYDKYRNAVAKSGNSFETFMTYLEHLIMDWSSRVWVMSEYNIAKSKPSRKIKLWFLSIGFKWKDDENLEFFLFDFDKTKGYDLFPKSDGPLDLNYFTYIASLYYSRFYRILVSQLNQKSFLQMMLGSKASRNVDRFYAIMPSSGYKDKLTSRDVVSSWQMDNIVSVKLKLYELMTTKDKLDLLHLTARHLWWPICTFPVFANINVTRWDALPVEEHDDKNLPCNFDLDNNATLRLVPPMENGIHFYKLNLSPKTYYVVDEPNGTVKKVFEDIFNCSKMLWKALEINYVDDELVYVYIPMYMENNLPEYLHQYTQHIALFGSFKKSKWLLCKLIFGKDHDFRVSIDNVSWKYYDNSDGNTTFDIY